MKCCSACGSVAVERVTVDAKTIDRCKKCGTTGCFKHLHQQIGDSGRGFGQATMGAGSYRYMPAGNKHS